MKAYRWGQYAAPLALLALFSEARLSNARWVELVQLRSFDSFMRARPRPYKDAPVIVVDIDDESLARLGQWPWPRTLLAQLVRRLNAAGASAIAFDAVFAEPDRAAAGNDAAFAREIARAPVILGVPLRHKANKARPLLKATFASRGELASFAPQAEGAVPNLPALEKAASGVGIITTTFDADGLIRRVPLAMTLGEQTFPSLAAEVLRVAQGARNYVVQSSLSESRGRQNTGVGKIRIGRLMVPTDELGRIYVYYSLRDARRSIPAWKALGPDASRVKGRIVLIGTSAEGLKDLRATPLEAAAPGVEVHANIIEQALAGDFLKRPDWALGFELLYMLILGGLLAALLPRLGAAWCLPLALFGIFGPIGFSWLMFTRKGLLVDPAFPAATTFGVYIASSIVSYLKSESERRQIKGAFSRYMSPALVEQLAKHPEKLKLGGEMREMTFHFCDIRGFTTISEQFDPHGLTQLINRFLTPMTDIILQHRGVIDKYMGDCIMAFWNAPLEDLEHARHACQAALRMHERLVLLNNELRAEAQAQNRKFTPIHIGTGLNTGRCVVGNMGSDMRFDYSVLGDDVNLASRLEGQSKTYGVNVVVGPLTREQAPEFAALELDLIRVKGKTVPVHIYALMGGPDVAGTEKFRALAELNDRMLSAYRARRWSEASELLARCRQFDFPLQALYDLYEQRISSYSAAPPAAGWDGSYAATSK